MESTPDDKIPEEKIVLRYTNTTDGKYRKYLGYLRDRRICRADSFVVAINAARLYKWAQAEGDPPRFLKALYPIGPYQVVFNKRTMEFIESRNEPRFHIEKASREKVPVQAFLDKSSRGISAVLCSLADVGSHRASLGFDF